MKDKPADKPASAPSEEPEVLIQSKLKLDVQTERELMQWAVLQRGNIRTQMGYNDAVGASAAGRGIYAYGTSHVQSSLTGWALIRREDHAQFENDFSHRTNSKRFSSIFRLFNESLNVPKRAVNIFTARTCENLLNTDPFLSLTPEGTEDDSDSVKAAEKLFHTEITTSGTRAHYRDGVRQAALSEAVMKTTLVQEEEDPEVGEFSVLLESPGGKPVRDSLGGYIFKDVDKVIPHPGVLGVRTLERDTNVAIPDDAIWSLPRRLQKPGAVTFRLEQRPVGWENFFCSTLEADIHKAPCIFHEFDEDLDDLLRRTRGMKLTRTAKEWLTNVAMSGENYPKAEGGQPHYFRGERPVEMGGTVKIHMCEMWMRYDVLKTGYTQEICVTWAVAHGGTKLVPVFYDLMKDCSPTGKRPFNVWRVIPVKDRWYGFGFYALLSNEHAFIDDSWTRIRARSSASGRFDWMRKDSWEGLEFGQPANLSDGRVHYLKTNVQGSAGDHAGSIAFPELDQNIWKMLEMAISNARAMSGTVMPSDVQEGGSPAGHTATGMNALMNESQLMANDATQDIMEGILESLRAAFIAVFSHLDKQWCNEQLGADKGEQLMNWLKDNPPRRWSRHVKLLLTKSRSRQALESVMNANKLITGGLSWLQIVTQYPQWIDQLRALFHDALAAMDISQAKKILEIPAAMMQPSAADPSAASTATPPQAPAPQ